MSELLKEKLEKLGFSAVEISPHSLRAGGATAAAEAGVPDHLFQATVRGGPKRQKMDM